MFFERGSLDLVKFLRPASLTLTCVTRCRCTVKMDVVFNAEIADVSATVCGSAVALVVSRVPSYLPLSVKVHLAHSSWPDQGVQVF